MTKEIWKPIKDYEEFYEVSNLGRVRSVSRWVVIRHRYGGDAHRFVIGRVLKKFVDRHGYSCHCMSKYGKSKHIHVHREVARAFLKKPKGDNIQVNHINGTKSDNRLENLEWCTQADNMKHAARTGLIKGRDNSRTLEWEDVCTIRELYASAQETQIGLAAIFGVSQPHINNICAWRTWLSNPEEGQNSQLSMKEAKQIRKVHKEEDLTYAQISRKFNCSKAKVLNVIHNRIFKE